jgi:hypothetical protein
MVKRGSQNADKNHMRFWLLPYPFKSCAISVVTATVLSSAASVAWAQMDPSSAILLDSARSNSRSGLDSGRYNIRPRGETTRRDGSRRSNSNSEVSVKTTPSETESTATETQTPVAEKTTDKQNSSETTQSTGVAPPAPTPAPQAPIPPENLPAKANAVERDERRLSILEISIAPGYMYTSSSSGYAYRSYNTASPALATDARVWLSPEFAVSAGFVTSLSGNVNDSADGARSVTASQQWLTAGLRSRHFFGETRLAPSLTFGLDYYEFQFRVSSDALLRERLQSSGAQLSLESEIPVNGYRSWIFGIGFAPKLQHKEIATGIDFQSGSSADANAVSISVGGKFGFDHSNAIFWKLSHSVEKDLFTGDASKPDPVSGLTPSGVSITNSTTLFQLGYTWGN